MYLSVYIEINVLCLLILAYILFRFVKTNDRREDSGDFLCVIIATITVIGADIMWVLSEGRPGAVFRFASIAANCVYLFGAGFIAFFWLLYTARTLGYRRIYTRNCIIASALPLLALFVMCVATPWTGWLFNVDSANIYQRGDMFFMHTIIVYSYITVSFILILVRLFSKEWKMRRPQFYSMLSVVFLPFAGGIITIFCPSIPATWPAMTLSLMVFFVNVQSRQISTDALTGLNNRRKFDEYLESMISDTPQNNEHIYLIIMDINAFKSINDTLGHVVGDEALKKTAQLLMLVCRTRHAFLARYGGDEFAIIVRCAGVSEVDNLVSEVEGMFRSFNASGAEEYKLSLSMGRVKLPQDGKTCANDLIATADALLYSAKEEYRRQNGTSVR